MSAPKYNVEVRTGDVLAGKYRVERILAAGGMGVVVEATHVGLNDRVAIKFLRFPQLADEDMINRFLREAQSAARIKSPHVARVVDVGTLDSGSPYIVMELLEGGDLQRLIDDAKGISLELAVRYALQTCEALAAAHARGIIHRDVKPGNLFLAEGPDREPIIKVLDFGISKVRQEAVGTDHRVTETQRSMGSPSYMSPEQMRSARRVDERTDIWSLGVVLYELLTGVVPFNAQTPPELYALVLDMNTRHAPARSLRPGLPLEIDALLDRCLAKDANQRFANVAELAWALAAFGGELGTRSASRCSRILGLTESARVPLDSSPQSPSAVSFDGTMPSVRSPPRVFTPMGPGTPFDSNPRTPSPLASTDAPPPISGRSASAPRAGGLDTSVAFGHTGWGPFGSRSKWQTIAAFAVVIGGLALAVGFATKGSHGRDGQADAANLGPNRVTPVAINPVSSSAVALPAAPAASESASLPAEVPAPVIERPPPATALASAARPGSAAVPLRAAVTKAAPKPGKGAQGAPPAGATDESALFNRK